MDDFWDQNLKAFQQSDPELLNELAGVELPTWTPIEARKGGLTFKLGELYLHSPYDPRREVQRLVEGTPEVLHVHLGLGLGYLLEADEASPDGAILVLEPHRELVLLAMKWTPLASLLRRKRAHLCCSNLRFKSLLGSLIRANRAYRLRTLPFHEQVLPQLLPQVKESIELSAFQSRVSLLTLKRNTAYLTAGSLTGLVYSSRLPGVQRLADSFAGRPAVIVSAGPSLDGNLIDLLPYRDRCLILAISRTARPLEKLGMAPHLLLHNEPKPFFSQIEDCTNLAETAFVLSLQAEAPYYQHPHGPTFVFQGPVNFVGQWLDALYPKLSKGTLDSGGSVSTEALSLAVLAGCNPIVLLGQDLSIKDGRYYAQAESNANFSHPAGDLLRVPGYFGETVSSLTSYYSFAQWLSNKALELKKRQPGLVLINATEGGVLIPGFQNMKLRDAAWRYFREPFDTRAVLAAAAKTEAHEVLPVQELAKLWTTCLKKIEHLRQLGEDFAAFSRMIPASGQVSKTQLQGWEHQLDTFKTRYVTYARGIEVLNGFMQADLLDIQERKRERQLPAEATPLARLLADRDDFGEVVAATVRAGDAMKSLLEGMIAKHTP